MVRAGMYLHASLLSAICAADAATIQKVGPEIAVNTTMRYRQLEPAVAALANGNFVVAWEDESKGASDPDIRARIFRPTGVGLASDFIVNTTRPAEQSRAAIAGLRNGGFVVAWQDWGGDGSGFAVRGQRYSNVGARLGGQFNVNRITRNDQQSTAVAALTGGGFAAAWDDGSYTGADPNTYHDVRGQAFTQAGARSGPEFRANKTTYTNQDAPAIAGLSTGNFVVTWNDISQTVPTGSGLQIRAQVHSPAGARLGGELVVNSTPEWSQRYSAVAGIDAGRFVVAWEDGSHSIDGDYNIRAQIMTSGGAKVGAELRVGRWTNNHQKQPAVAGFRDGRFVVVWTDESAASVDLSGRAIRGQVYSRTGAKLGAEFVVNTTKPNDQLDPAVAAVGANLFVVAWTDWSGIGADSQYPPGIRAQVFRVTP
jgi:hypothetical protein